MRSMLMKHHYIYYWRMWALYILINCQEVTMSPPVRRTLNENNQDFCSALKGSAIEKIINNLKQKRVYFPSSVPVAVDAETQTASLFDPMAETTIIAFREEGTQVNLFNKDIALENEMTNSLFDRWVKVAEGYRCQRDVLHKNLEEIKARAKALESMIEKQDEKYEELVLRNLSLSNFIHELRIGSGKVLGIMRDDSRSGDCSSVGDSEENWRRCLQPGCNYREFLKNNNMARHFRRKHPKVKYGPSCYERCSN